MQRNFTYGALDSQKEEQLMNVTSAQNANARSKNHETTQNTQQFQAATCTFSHFAPLGRAKRKVIFEKKTLVVHSVDCQASHQHVMPLDRHDFYDFAGSIHFSKCRLTLYG